MNPDDLTPEQAEELALAQEEREGRLQTLGSTLSVKLKKYISAREPIERRMIEDLRQYHGRYDRETEARMNDPEYKRSKVFANITRSKTNAAESRISDMLFPADDRNWGIQPTPNPEISNLAKQAKPPVDGEPIPDEAHEANVADSLMKTAKDRSKAMEREIEDQLVEARYNIEARRSIHQASVLGTGVLKGPINVVRSNRRWTCSTRSRRRSRRR